MTRLESIRNWLTRATPVVGGRFSPPETDSDGSVSVSLPKNPKTRTDWRKPIIRRKSQILVIKNLDLSQKTRIQALFHVDVMKFWANLAKSHRIQWDYRRIWWNLIDSDEIFVGSRFFWPFLVVSSFFYCFLRSLTPTDPSAHPLKSDPPDPFTPAVGDGWVFPKTKLAFLWCPTTIFNMSMNNH